ncbi:hypothetical protein SAZ11_59200 [Streptomyces sp. FXJ1.4098]|nr:hypothetical protein [Streptomyces sp. FXJ1.4098]
MLRSIWRCHWSVAGSSIGAGSMIVEQQVGTAQLGSHRSAAVCTAVVPVTSTVRARETPRRCRWRRR